MLLFGGCNAESTSVRKYSAASRQWTKLPDLASERRGHCSVVVGKHVYLVSGAGNRTIERYDPEIRSATTVCELAGFRYSFGACLHRGDQIMVAGGCTDTCWQTDSCFLFDTATGALKEAGRMRRGRRCFALVNCRGAVYAIGGLLGRRDMRSIETFDAVAGEWRKAPFELVVGRRNHCAVAHDHCIYVFGGETGADRLRVFRSVERIDTRTNRVETLGAKLGSWRSNCCAVKVGSRVLLLGGITQSARVTNEMEWFDLEEEKMGSAGETIPAENVRFTACAL